MKEIFKIIDHTLLIQTATLEEIKKLCEEAKTYSFASVCVNPYWVSTAAELLKNNEDVKVCTVIGFPLGASTTETKVFETMDAIKNGATEIDMVINISALKNKEYEKVKTDIKKVVETAKNKALVKVIIETCLLTQEEKIKACELSKEAGANFVKTSTGFSTNGATVDDVLLMRKTVGDKIGVKASGGVKSIEDIHNLIKAGANRIGTSAGAQIAKGKKSKFDY